MKTSDWQTMPPGEELASLRGTFAGSSVPSQLSFHPVAAETVLAEH